MTRDVETLELILSQINSQWQRPLDDHELEVWKRTLAPAGQDQLDPEIAARVLLMLKGREEFGIMRPSVVAFKSHYDRAVQATIPAPPDLADMPVSRERAREHIEAAKAALKAAGEPKADCEPAGTLL
jgi:hypothetical protein